MLFVSILVLMDITLLHMQMDYNKTVSDCFNPCFNGYYTFTLSKMPAVSELISVSILVLMDITLLLVQSKTIGITRTQQQ